MNHFVDFFLSPFSEFIFMRHALVACLALALGCARLDSTSRILTDLVRQLS